MKDDLDDIPMTYLLYVLLAIAAIVAAAAIVITRMFWHLLCFVHARKLRTLKALYRDSIDAYLSVVQSSWYYLFPFLSGCLRHIRLSQQPELNSSIVSPGVLQLVETTNRKCFK